MAYKERRVSEQHHYSKRRKSENSLPGCTLLTKCPRHGQIVAEVWDCSHTGFAHPKGRAEHLLWANLAWFLPPCFLKCRPGYPQVIAIAAFEAVTWAALGNG